MSQPETALPWEAEWWHQGDRFAIYGTPSPPDRKVESARRGNKAL